MRFAVKTAVDDLGEGRYFLIVECLDEGAMVFFEEQGYDGNGYTWHAIVDALARSRLGSRYEDLSFSPEADNLMVTSADKRLLTELETAVSAEASSTQGLQRLLQRADPELLE